MLRYIAFKHFMYINVELMVVKFAALQQLVCSAVHSLTYVTVSMPGVCCVWCCNVCHFVFCIGTPVDLICQ